MIENLTKKPTSALNERSYEIILRLGAESKKKKLSRHCFISCSRSAF